MKNRITQLTALLVVHNAHPEYNVIWYNPTGDAYLITPPGDHMAAECGYIPIFQVGEMGDYTSLAAYIAEHTDALVRATPCGGDEHV